MREFEVLSYLGSFNLKLKPTFFLPLLRHIRCNTIKPFAGMTT